ncbi:MAG: dihydroorotate dehydrogenase electron transfer subunit [Candidatus Cloacimonetes bacterium]|nr:dihydroorotate dehydrogenase electron transfer subunit [Candidatus Cloacimonadota bacterium]
MAISQTSIIVKKETLNNSHFILWIRDEKLSEQSLPGQFFQLRSPRQDSSSLYKPISIFNNEKSCLGFMIKSLGKGTQSLSELDRGDKLEVIGPLGTSFPPCQVKNVVLISGGIGYAPLWYLSKKLKLENYVYWLHGGNSKPDVFPCDEIWTEDGSIGYQGLVTQGLETRCSEHPTDIIIACGSGPMLKAIQKIAKAHRIELIVSMEAYMACGIGACYGCAVPCGDTGNVYYKRVCKDGPVFNSNEICWELL